MCVETLEEGPFHTSEWVGGFCDHRLGLTKKPVTWPKACYPQWGTIGRDPTESTGRGYSRLHRCRGPSCTWEMGAPGKLLPAALFPSRGAPAHRSKQPLGWTDRAQDDDCGHGDDGDDGVEAASTDSFIDIYYAPSVFWAPSYKCSHAQDKSPCPRGASILLGKWIMHEIYKSCPVSKREQG